MKAKGTTISSKVQISTQGNAIYVATPEPGPTRLADQKRNLGDAHFILFIYILLHFLFQKCHDPNPWLDPKGGFEPEPGLLRRFHLSYQNIFFMLFLFRFLIAWKNFQMVGPQKFTFHKIQLQ